MFFDLRNYWCSQCEQDKNVANVKKFCRKLVPMAKEFSMIDSVYSYVLRFDFQQKYINRFVVNLVVVELNFFVSIAYSKTK